MESDETVLFPLLRTRVEECRLGGSDWFVLGKELLPFLQKMDEWLPRSAQREHILPVHEMQLNLYCLPCEMVPASGVLRMLVSFSRIWWTTSLPCSTMADFSDWYRLDATVAFINPGCTGMADISCASMGRYTLNKRSSEMSASTHKPTQCHNSEEHNLIYLEHLNTHVPQFSSAHQIRNSGYLPSYLQQN